MTKDGKPGALAVRKPGPELTERGFTQDYLEDLFHQIPDLTLKDRTSIMLVAATAETAAYELQCRICAQYADARELTAFVGKVNKAAVKKGMKTVSVQNAHEMSQIGHRLEYGGKRMTVDFPHLTRTYFQHALDGPDDSFIGVLEKAEVQVAGHEKDPKGTPALTTRHFKDMVHGREPGATLPPKTTGKQELLKEGGKESTLPSDYAWELPLHVQSGGVIDEFVLGVNAVPAGEPLVAVDIIEGPAELNLWGKQFMWGGIPYMIVGPDGINVKEGILVIPKGGAILKNVAVHRMEVMDPEKLQQLQAEAFEDHITMEDGGHRVSPVFPDALPGEQPLWEQIGLKGGSDVLVPSGLCMFDDATGQAYRTTEDCQLSRTGLGSCKVERLAVVGDGLAVPVAVTAPSTDTEASAPELEQQTLTLGCAVKIQTGEPVTPGEPLYLDPEDGMFYGSPGDDGTRMLVSDRIRLDEADEVGGKIVAATIVPAGFPPADEVDWDDLPDTVTEDIDPRYLKADGSLVKNCHDCTSCKVFGEGRHEHQFVALMNIKGTETIDARDRGAVSFWCITEALPRRIIAVRSRAIPRAVALARGCPHFERRVRDLEAEQAEASEEVSVPIDSGADLLEQLEDGDDTGDGNDDTET